MKKKERKKEKVLFTMGAYQQTATHAHTHTHSITQLCNTTLMFKKATDDESTQGEEYKNRGVVPGTPAGGRVPQPPKAEYIYCMQHKKKGRHSNGGALH